MDAQSRGRADEIDPADQWVLNPRTGNYELRLADSDAQARPKVTAPRRSPSAPSTPTKPTPGVPRPRRGDPPPGGRRGGRSRKLGGGGRKKALAITGGVVAFLLVGGGVAGYLYYDHLNGNLSVTDVAGAAPAVSRRTSRSTSW